VLCARCRIPIQDGKCPNCGAEAQSAALDREGESRTAESSSIKFEIVSVSGVTEKQTDPEPLDWRTELKRKLSEHSSKARSGENNIVEEEPSPTDATSAKDLSVGEGALGTDSQEASGSPEKDTSEGAVPETADIVPETADIVPETADIVPETADIVPETADTVPEIADTVPETESLREEEPPTDVVTHPVDPIGTASGEMETTDQDADSGADTVRESSRSAEDSPTEEKTEAIPSEQLLDAVLDQAPEPARKAPGEVSPKVTPRQRKLSLGEPPPSIYSGLAKKKKRPALSEGKISNEILLSRLLAGIIDLTLPVLIAFGFVAAASWKLGFDLLGYDSLIWVCVFAGFFFIFNSIFFLLSSGQTPGMVLTDLNIVSAEPEEEIPAGTLVLRIVFFLLSLASVIGLLWALVDSRKCCLHDILSGTRVVPANPVPDF